MRKHMVKVIIAVELLLIIMIPLFCFNWKQGKTSKSENRVLAKFPTLFDEEGELSETLPDDLENWFEDNLGFRDSFLNISSFINYNIFHRSTSEKVELGKDGWLYYTWDNNLKLASDEYPDFDEECLKQYCDAQIATQRRLAEQGIEYVLVLPPSKASIYPEYIDSGDYSVRKTAADLFADYMEEHSDVKVVRLKDTLLEEKLKTDELLYFKTDTHWNVYGWYVGYKKIISDLNAWGILNGNELKVEFYPNGSRIGDLSRMMGPVKLNGGYLNESVMDWRFTDAKAYVVNDGAEYERIAELAEGEGIVQGHYSVYRNDAVEDKNVLIYGDSMIGGCLLPALAENFSDLVFCWTYTFNQEMIDAVKPDVIIEDISERGLNKYLKEFNEKYLKTKVIFDAEKNTMDLYYYDNREYDSMFFPTWSRENGQDDLVWYEAERTDEDTWHVLVDLNSHHTNGRYDIHIYDGPSGAGNFVCSISYDVGTLTYQ